MLQNLLIQANKNAPEKTSPSAVHSDSAMEDISECHGKAEEESDSNLAGKRNLHSKQGRLSFVKLLTTCVRKLLLTRRFLRLSCRCVIN